MARFTVSIVLLAVLALRCLKVDAFVQSLAVESPSTEATCEPGLPPTYFGEPLLQDLRYLVAFALGYACMRILDPREEDCIPVEEEQHLQIYPLLTM